MVVLEAMALGRPVVATRCGGPEEMVVHGQTGILVDRGDTRALAGELAALARDPDARERLGSAAREAVAGRFDSETVAGELSRLYTGIAALPRTSG